MIDHSLDKHILIIYFPVHVFCSQSCNELFIILHIHISVTRTSVCVLSYSRGVNIIANICEIDNSDVISLLLHKTIERAGRIDNRANCSCVYSIFSHQVMHNAVTFIS